MKVLSIRQPWAWLIVEGAKDIENRNWPTRFRGVFLIHASSGLTRMDYKDCQKFCIKNGSGIILPPPEELLRGGIVGQARVVDCVKSSDSRWFVGPWGFVIRDAYSMPFQQCKGALGFFDSPEGYEEET